MTKQAGFTIVEIALTIAIMGILLTLVVAGLGSAQASSRDEERTTDVETIARSLETFYTTGDDTVTTRGRYPGTSPLQSQLSSGGTRFTLLSSIDPNAVKAPDQTTISLVMATNATQTTAGVRPIPTRNTYVYQPLSYNAATNTYSLCTNHATTECRKFNLYYMLEKGSVIQKVTSKNQ